jgi:perosamine synthetase
MTDQHSDLRLAAEGGAPVRAARLPYGRQQIDEDDIAAVVGALRGDWLTTGPAVEAFERALQPVTGAPHVVAVSNGTTALHAMLAAAGLGPGDEVIVPAMTFVATANAVLYCGAKPVIVDVDPATLLIDPAAVAAAVGPATKAVIGVDYGGQPADHDALRAITARHGLRLFADGCHALGATDQGRLVGSLADATTFSFHPVKHIATGEGGAIATADAALAGRMRRLRNHGLSQTAAERERAGTFRYEMAEWGHNFRLTDLQCALGTSQLRKLEANLARRRALAARYATLLAEVEGVEPLAVRPGVEHAWHLYVVRLPRDRWAVDRDELHRLLMAEGIGANVHYLPVHLHAYHQAQGARVGQCPVAEAAYAELLTLPLHHGMSDNDQDDVIAALQKLRAARGR